MTPVPAPMIQFDRASVRLGQRQILDNVSFTVQPGETLVLVGRSGAGKTTALRAINRLVELSGGALAVEGNAVRDWDPIRLRRRIGYVIQEIGLFPHFTVERNVALVPRLEGWQEPKIQNRVEELLDAVGLPPAEYARRYPRELSGGQRQRVGIARALAADPPILLFDEPFGALDPITRLDLQRQFLDLRRRWGKTAVFVTHDVREALALGNRIAIMRDGQIELLGTPAELLASENPEVRAFLEVLNWKLEN